MQLYTRLHLSDLNFETLIDGSLLTNIFASSNCFSDRSILQNGVDALSKIDEAFCVANSRAIQDALKKISEEIKYKTENRGKLFFAIKKIQKYFC